MYVIITTHMTPDSLGCGLINQNQSSRLSLKGTLSSLPRGSELIQQLVGARAATMVLIRDAMMIFTIMDSYLRGPEAHKRSSVLESFPQSFEFIPWRRVYKQVAVAESASKN